MSHDDMNVTFCTLLLTCNVYGEMSGENYSGCGSVCFRYLQADPEHFDLRELKSQFDVILLEPPLEEYYRESGISHTERFWTWDDVRLVSFLSC